MAHLCWKLQAKLQRGGLLGFFEFRDDVSVTGKHLKWLFFYVIANITGLLQFA